MEYYDMLCIGCNRVRRRRTRQDMLSNRPNRVCEGEWIDCSSADVNARVFFVDPFLPYHLCFNNPLRRLLQFHCPLDGSRIFLLAAVAVLREDVKSYKGEKFLLRLTAIVPFLCPLIAPFRRTQRRSFEPRSCSQATRSNCPRTADRERCSYGRTGLYVPQPATIL